MLNIQIWKLNGLNTMCYYMTLFDTSVKPKDFQLIETSNDVRRHGCGTYLFKY
jgi:hypothetical protein